MSPRSVTSRASTARTKAPAASSLAHSGARERSTSSASSVETIRVSAGDGRLAARPVAKLARPRRRRPAARAEATSSASESSFLSSAGEEAATASTALERSISATLAPSALAAARATAGRPAPDSIASESASSVASSAPFAGTFGSPASSSPRNRSGAQLRADVLGRLGLEAATSAEAAQSSPGRIRVMSSQK